MLLPLLIASLSVLPLQAQVVTRALPDAVRSAAPATPQPDSGLHCDDGTDGGTLVQRFDAYYGNRFSTGCAAALLQSVSFVHYGYAFAGPYSYRLHVLDTACREIGVTDVLRAASATQAPASVDVDLSSLGLCVGPEFFVMLEPQTCSDGPVGQDCFPAIVFDTTSDNDPSAHCASVSAQTITGRQCLAARSADGRYFDLRMRVRVACNSGGCTSAVAHTAWSNVKLLYVSPR
jgi:hypothetical protein